jgi:PIN domain nuclease of toxin-antitoxin system
MKLLLDTPILLWAVLEPGKLNRGLREALECPETQLLNSAAFAWENATTDAAVRQFDGLRLFGG